ncbi:glycosyltransferase [Brevibacillus migulae]|uniref:glycosyltransferase n=1 Tax=Brevibacillus migulae TaxID=1644114 RepID=UPI00142FF095|nr:glycosyltransferase [Brevibacillus migulae]
MKQPLRIVFVMPNLAGGGAERVMVTVLRHLDRSRFEPILMTVELSGPYVALIPEDVQVVNLQAGRVRHAWRKMVKEINRLQPAVVMSTMDYMNLAVIAGKMAFAKKPRIVIREANTPTHAIGALSSLKRVAFKALYRLLYPKADLVIVQSEGMKQDLLDFLPHLSQEKVIRIYNPLDVASVLQKAARKEEAFLLPAGKQIVAAGRLTYQKGFDLLLAAFAQVAKAVQDARLAILGEGPLEGELKAQARALGIEERVSFLGFQENPYAFLAQADLFVLPSRWEGFPNILLEALACGCQVVAADCPSGPREILQGNRYGLLVEPERVAALTAGMISVLCGEYKFAPGRERALAYDAKQVVNAYEQAFEHGRVEEGAGERCERTGTWR